MPSSRQNPRKTRKVNPKLISEDTFWESRNRYFGTLTLVKMPALSTNEDIPVGGVAEVGENECPGKQVCGIVVCCPAKKFGEYDSHDEQG